MRWALATLSGLGLLAGTLQAARAQEGTPDNALQEAIPPAFQQLIDRGKVRFEYYDPAFVQRQYPGRAQFQMAVQQSYALSYETQQRGRNAELSIRPRMKSVTYELRHVVTLPERECGNWGSPLVRHEFDHVAISTDPRVEMLLRRLYAKVEMIRRRLDPNTAIDQPLLQQITNEEIAKRREAVKELLNANYRLLDKVSAHGVREIPNREEFFRWLYTKPNLDEAGFPYTGDVLELLASEEYRNVELPRHVR